MSEFRTFDSREMLQSAAAELIASTLRRAVAERGEAHLALSGGSTPGPVYDRLSRNERVAWDKVHVRLADERITPPDKSDHSNHHLLRQTLLRDKASSAHFEEPAAGQSLPDQDLILLGMGGDGHFASLFPQARELEAALAGDAPDMVHIVPDPLPEGAPYERLSMSLPAILRARSLLLLITGEDKRQVFTEAHRSAPREHPISALLSAQPEQLTTYWAP
jgi:6-phosphogluconolactonase